MHQGQGLSSEVHSESSWFDKTILHMLSQIKYMQKKKMVFKELLDINILIRLGVLQNNTLEPHGPAETMQTMQKQRDREIYSPHCVEKAWTGWRRCW